MTDIRRIQDAEVAGKRVLVRVDFNVPLKDGAVSDDTRLRAALPTLNHLRQAGAKIILLAHFGRPKGQRNLDMSLSPVVAPLSGLLGAEVKFAADDASAEAMAKSLGDGEILLLENTRFHPGEEKNDPAYAEALAALGDLYVNDAFSAAHRAHGSTEGVARLIPAYAGLAMQGEIDALVSALDAPERPVLAIVGGAKVSTKIELLENLVTKVDMLFVGGGMANTLLHAQGVNVGVSLCEKEMADTAKAIFAAAEKSGCRILLPSDVLAAKEFAPNPEFRIAPVSEIAEDEMILDCGPATITMLALAADEAKTVIWNGPLGAFETPPFDTGTMTAAKQIADMVKSGALIAVAGGGDTVAALNQAGVADDFTFLSTAGGAFLEWMEGKQLPGVEALKAEVLKAGADRVVV